MGLLLLRRALPGSTVAAVLVAASAARATPVYSVPFNDGDVLNVKATIGSGVTTAYLAVDFTDGTDEAFQYNFNGPLNGYQLLKDVEAGSTLQDSETDKYLIEYGEHFIYSVSDGSESTVTNVPAIYFSPPLTPDDGNRLTDTQGVTFDQSQVGIDELNITSGEIVAFGNSYSVAPSLPETAVPEPATLALTTVGVSCGLLRRRRRPAARA